MADWRDSYLIDFLKNANARISIGDKWLVYDGNDWVVYEAIPYRHTPKVLYRESYLSQEALDILGK